MLDRGLSLHATPLNSSMYLFFLRKEDEEARDVCERVRPRIARRCPEKDVLYVPSQLSMHTG